LELGPRLRVGGYDLQVVESVRVESHEGGGVWIRASKEPVAVVVREPGATRALGMDGAPLSLEAVELS
jgi:hypothetical protein